MNPRIFGGPFRLRGFNWADVVVLLSLVGLLAIVAWLGHSLWAPFTPDVPVALDLDPWRLPCYAARSLLRMFAALGASLLFTLVIASWAARSTRAARVILPILDVLQSVPVLGFLSATVERTDDVPTLTFRWHNSDGSINFEDTLTPQE